MNIDAFNAQFAFSEDRAFKVSVERECFLVDTQGIIVPRAQEVLSKLQLAWGSSRFDNELSACQIESRVSLLDPHEVGSYLAHSDDILHTTLRTFELSPSYKSVGAADMPLDVYPEKRYKHLAQKMSREVLLSACRVIGTHVHVGMPDRQTALRVHNNMQKHLGMLCKIGDRSKGVRLTIYKSIAPDWNAPPFESWEDFHHYALESGFAHDLRSWWSLMRISRHGTYEGRMFDATEKVEEVNEWALTFWRLCLLASK